MKIARSEIIFKEDHFKDFQKEMNIIEMKEFRETNISLFRSVNSSLKALDISLSITKFEYTSFIDSPVEATMQVLHDMKSWYRVDEKDEILKKQITFSKRRRKKLETDENPSQYLLLTLIISLF